MTYAHHLFFMFYLFHIEEEHKAGEPLSYSVKLLEAGVIDVINENKSLVEPFSDIVEKVFFSVSVRFDTKSRSFSSTRG